MERDSLDCEQITIPRWTIKRDPRALGCPVCGSVIVKITAEWRQVSFCTCRLIEYSPSARTGATKTKPESSASAAQ